MNRTEKKDMLLDSTMIKAQRRSRAWSQTELATVAGLSLRTVQRIEKSGVASLESVKALASVFELLPDELQIKSSAPAEDDSKTSKINQNLLQGQNTNEASSTKLSKQAIQASLYIFVPSLIIVLFLLFSNMPNLHWVHDIRMSLFSDALPSTIKTILNLVISLFPVFILSLSVGVIWELYKRQEAVECIKRAILRAIVQSPKNTWMHCKTLTFKTLKAISLLRKPLMFSIVLFSLSIISIAATMEPYQKDNLKHFVAKVLETDTN